MALPFAQELVFGAVLGSYIALAAVGFTLVYGLVNMINFAHGEFVTIGAYVGFAVSTGLDLPVVATVVPVVLVSAVAGWALAQGFFEPLNDAGPIPLLLTSIGVGLILRNGFRLTAGASPRYLDTAQATTWRFSELGFFVNSQQGIIVGLTAVAVLAVHLFLTRTKTGTAMRAASDNEDLARVTGVDTGRIRSVVWLLASGLAGLAGLMLAFDQSANPSLGFSQLLLVITAAILGGAGSVYGAVVGSYVLGIVVAVATATLPPIASELGTTMAFVVLIAVLLVRPTGIAGGEVRN